MDINQIITDVTSDIKIHFDKLENVKNEFNKFNIYNPNIFIPMQKFWFYIENVRIVDNINTKKYVEIALSENIHKSIINYIDNLEIEIEKYIKLINPKYTFIKSVQKTTSFYPLIKIKIPLSTIIYDSNDEIINNLHKNDSINLYMELSNIWINKFTHNSWSSFESIQIKKNKIIVKIEIF